MKRGTRSVVAASIIGLYGLLALVSGRLSPTARGPLLDGLGPTQPYRWVAPPSALASTNQAPSVGRFVVKFVRGSLRGQVFVTGDAQATVIVPNATFPPRAGDTSVVLTLTPVAPSTLGPLPDSRVAFGNAYRLTGVYRPSGVAVPQPSSPIDLVLLYPVTPDLHAATHAVYTSTDGKRWTALHSTDTPSVQQTAAKAPALGYAVVGGVLAPMPTPTGGTPNGGSVPTTLLLVVSASVLLVGIGLLLRSRGGGAPTEPS